MVVVAVVVVIVVIVVVVVVVVEVTGIGILQAPSIPKHLKKGWEAVDRYFFGFMDSKLFTKFAVPDATAVGWGSKSLSEKIGLCTDKAKAEKDGPLLARESFCACGPCIRLDFENCEMTAHVGKMRRVSAPLAKGATTRAPQLQSLQVSR